MEAEAGFGSGEAGSMSWINFHDDYMDAGVRARAHVELSSVYQETDARGRVFVASGSLAVDGIKSPDFRERSCAQTTPETQPWLKVHFPEEILLTKYRFVVFKGSARLDEHSPRTSPLRPCSPRTGHPPKPSATVRGRAH